MAFIDWSSVKEVDCSKHYKTFLDLSENDKIFLIDFEKLDIKDFIIKNITIEENNSYKILNRFEVKFEIPGVAYISISDGNRYLDKTYINNKDAYLVTDKRIAEIIIDLLRSRNSYQWKCLTGIFGNPLNKYAEKDVIIS